MLAVSYYKLTVISSAFLLCVSLHEINIGSCVATLQHCDAPPCIIVLLCEQKTESKFCPVRDPFFFLHVKVLQLWSTCTWLSDQLMYMYMYVCTYYVVLRCSQGKETRQETEEEGKRLQPKPALQPQAQVPSEGKEQGLLRQPSGALSQAE